MRDPRDVLVSSYFAHLNSHPTDQWPELVAHREELQALSKEEGLLCELHCRAEQFEDMLAWHYDTPHILERRMEDFIDDPVGQFSGAFTHWGRLDADNKQRGFALRSCYNRVSQSLERRLGRRYAAPRWKMDRINTTLIRQLTDSNDFSMKSGGRIRGQQDMTHHYRTGMPGDWRNHFFSELTTRFKVQFNDVLVKLGYESNADW